MSKSLALTREDINNPNTWSLKRLQRARAWGGVVGLRYLARLVLSRSGRIDMETRKDAAKALLNVGFSGIPPIAQEIAQPTWLQEIIKSRAERITYRQEVVIEGGIPSSVGEGLIPESLGAQGIQRDLVTIDNTNYVQLPAEKAQEREKE